MYNLASAAAAMRRASRWRWARCLAGAGLLLALWTVPAGAQQPQQQPQREQQQPQPPQQGCFTVVMNRGGGSIGSILVDQCTGKTWRLVTANLPRGGSAMRWFPITVETNELVFSGPPN
jgi:hypothetical protein